MVDAPRRYNVRKPMPPQLIHLANALDPIPTEISSLKVI